MTVTTTLLIVVKQTLSEALWEVLPTQGTAATQALQLAIRMLTASDP